MQMKTPLGGRRWLGPTLLWLTLALLVTSVEARTLRLFVIGNSFSQNATRYLPDIARDGGHELILRKAQAGGCFLERHWNALAAALADPTDPAGHLYGGQSLPELLGDETWDVITLQQVSWLSGDPTSYHPFFADLSAYLHRVQPEAEQVVHQIWAYRVDADRFGRVTPDRNAADQVEMWTATRAAYRAVAREFGLRLLPVGDAFQAVHEDPVWGYRPDPAVAAQTWVEPAVPEQPHSLHVGYRWKDGTFGKDANHANVAGEYLGALVWYGVLFAESPTAVTFVPDGLDADFAAHLRAVAAETVAAIEPFNRLEAR
ncbi:DUF4886 domain-containing protein [Actomonas aquatica]|uniref:DUF4886 domain-containing protein n=1 Tax=Actomonas aquatica TaxID=2866162 RepID=A0ABZ1C626_9BACT|nr:DUF4886 domain-containing protein [Opitutus sp. WL0086]WRQ85755.1 DUF4886 domain-containing protein [Opitutus sp. WL0086]